MSNVQVATIRPDLAVSFPSDADWRRIIDVAGRAYKSGLLPAGIKNPEAATIIALKAWELGIAPMLGFHHIHVVNGKPGYSAELMQLLVRRNLPGVQITILESTSKKASVKIKRPEKNASPFTFTFTIEDAKAAGLLVKEVWQKYPTSMLWARCISLALRTMCSDALNGASHTPEEIGDESAIVTTSRPYEESQVLTEEIEAREISANEVPAGMPPLPIVPDKETVDPDWRMSVDQLDALKLHCTRIGWDNKRVIEEIEKIIGRKKGPSQLTRDEYLMFIDSVGYNEN